MKQLVNQELSLRQREELCKTKKNKKIKKKIKIKIRKQ